MRLPAAAPFEWRAGHSCRYLPWPPWRRTDRTGYFLAYKKKLEPRTKRNTAGASRQLAAPCILVRPGYAGKQCDRERGAGSSALHACCAQGTSPTLPPAVPFPHSLVGLDFLLPHMCTLLCAATPPSQGLGLWGRILAHLTPALDSGRFPAAHNEKELFCPLPIRPLIPFPGFLNGHRTQRGEAEVLPGTRPPRHVFRCVVDLLIFGDNDDAATSVIGAVSYHISSWLLAMFWHCGLLAIGCWR